MNEEEKNAHEADIQKVVEEEFKTENWQEKNLSDKNQETTKKIAVVNGNGGLTISPVYEHLEVEKPKPKENRKIFIPEVKGSSSQEENINKKTDSEENNLENSNEENK